MNRYDLIASSVDKSLYCVNCRLKHRAFFSKELQKNLPKELQESFATVEMLISSLNWQAKLIKKGRPIRHFVEWEAKRIRGSYFYPNHLCPAQIVEWSKIKLNLTYP